MDDGKFLRETLSPHWWDLSPGEAKVFLTLYWLADPDTHGFSMPLFKLARQVNMPTKELITPVRSLAKRDLIKLKAGANPFLDSHFKILCRKREFPPVSKNYVNVNDQRSNRSFKKDDTDNVKRNGFKKTNDTERSLTCNGAEKHSPQLTAEELAIQFDDLPNVALYEAYLNRYPEEIIRKAYEQVLNTPKEKIKKNPGAYFTFLVKRLATQ